LSLLPLHGGSSFGAEIKVATPAIPWSRRPPAVPGSRRGTAAAQGSSSPVPDLNDSYPPIRLHETPV
jgi:hypothetical protein